MPAGCERSSRSYPALVAQALRLNADQARDMSCSGAAIADLSVPQPADDGTNAAQLTALPAATTLVTRRVQRRLNSMIPSSLRRALSVKGRVNDDGDVGGSFQSATRPATTTGHIP